MKKAKRKSARRSADVAFLLEQNAQRRSETEALDGRFRDSNRVMNESLDSHAARLAALEKFNAYRVARPWHRRLRDWARGR